MQEHRATPTSDSRSGIVVDFDNEVVKRVGAAQPVAWFTGRLPEWLIIAPILRVLAPGVGRTDAAKR
jgi:hypothetical protein